MVVISQAKLPSGEHHGTLVMISQHWFRQWLGTIRHQAITSTSVDLDPCHHMASLGHNELNSICQVSFSHLYHELLSLEAAEAVEMNFRVEFPVHPVTQLYFYLNSLRLRQTYGSNFADATFKRILLTENLSITIKNSLKFVSSGLMANISSLVEIMTWCWKGNKLLSEIMMVWFTDTYMHQWVNSDNYKPSLKWKYQHIDKSLSMVTSGDVKMISKWQPWLLPEPMLNNHHWGLVFSAEGNFTGNAVYIYNWWIWILLIQNNSRISMGPISWFSTVFFLSLLYELNINSLAPGRSDYSLQLINFKLISITNSLNIFC